MSPSIDTPSYLNLKAPTADFLDFTEHQEFGIHAFKGNAQVPIAERCQISHKFFDEQKNTAENQKELSRKCTLIELSGLDYSPDTSQEKSPPRNDPDFDQTSKVVIAKKIGTPLAKQAKRHKESKDRWKSKAVQRSLDINALGKRITELKKSRDFQKMQNAALNLQIEKMTLELAEAKQNLANEIVNKEKCMLAESKALKSHAELEKVIVELKEANKKKDEIINFQLKIEEKINLANNHVDEYVYEMHYAPESIQTIEVLEKITKDIVEIDKETQQAEVALQIELSTCKKQVNVNDDLFGNHIYKDFLNLYQIANDCARSKIEVLKSTQLKIKNSLKSLCDRFKNKKNRQGDFQQHERAKEYSYSISIIQMILLLMLRCNISLRASAKATEVISMFFDIPNPSPSVINDWSKKIGFYVYNQPKNKNVECIWIIDFSIQIGKNKLMLVLSLDTAKIEEWKKFKKKGRDKKNWLKINFQDIEIIHMAVLESTAYQFTLNELDKTAEKCGLPVVILTDEGNDLAKGIRIFIGNHPGIIHLNDISHKISNILKSELEHDPKWNEFCSIVTKIKQQIKNSKIAYLCPPKFRQKVRFLNIRNPIWWAFRMLNMSPKNLSKMNREERDLFNTYIKKPLNAFKKEIIQWYEITCFITEVEAEIKHFGLTRGEEDKTQSTSKILAFNLKGKKFCKSARKIFTQVLVFIEHQESKLAPGQTVIASTDLVESVYGKWKNMIPEDSMAGITDKILVLPLLTVKLTKELIKKALEDNSIKKIDTWCEEILIESICAKRRAALKSENRGQNPRGTTERKSRKIA